MPELTYYIDMLLRIALACLVGGVVGYEREQTNRPAGFRTHILVCVGAALVMMTGEYIYTNFGGNTDPARLGAQVVSGIGFLGAGTILRAGFNVRGLTTAASLWAVSCVGLACGIGFYFAAIASALTICVTLVFFKRFERRIWVKNSYKAIFIKTTDIRATMAEITDVFTKNGIEIKNMEFKEDAETLDTPQTSIKFSVKMPNCSIPELYDQIKNVKNVDGVLIE